MLTDDDRDRLNLEAAHWVRPGRKDAAIRDRFGETPAQFAARVLVLLDDPAAVTGEPVIVRRLRRVRDARRLARTF